MNHLKECSWQALQTPLQVLPVLYHGHYASEYSFVKVACLEPIILLLYLHA